MLDTSQVLNQNTMIYKNDTKSFTNITTKTDASAGNYEIEAELYGYELRN
jgi:hypothetical protein